jgi:putative flippase GtrA
MPKSVPMAAKAERMGSRPKGLGFLSGEARTRSEAARFTRFLGVGFLGLGVDAAIFVALQAAGLGPASARALSLSIAIAVTWRGNRLFTFGPSGRSSRAEAARYAVVALGTQAFSYAVFLALVVLAPALPPLGSLFVGSGLAALASFLGHRFFSFAPQRHGLRK